MTSKKVAINVGNCRINDRAKQLVSEVLDNERLSAGPMMARFEQGVATIHGARYGLFCNSGTSALQIALAALKERHGWQAGDEVLVPALTFVATSNVVLYNDLRPVFVEVEADHFCMDPDLVEEKISDRTRAIMPVHVGGLPCDMDPLVDLARRHDLRIVEDCAEAMFASYRGRFVGSFSDIAGFSTYVAHMISTGVGGVCITDDAGLMDMLRSSMNHGRDSIYTRIDDDQGVEGRELAEIANRRFSFDRLGHSFRCTEMEAALGIAELEQWEAYCASRRRVAARLTDGLQNLSAALRLPGDRPGAENRYMFYPLEVLDPRVSRDQLIAHLEDHGIETRHLLPLLNQPIYKRIFGDLEPAYPVAARLNRNAFYVGSHPGMSDEDVDYMVECFQAFFRSSR